MKELAISLLIIVSAVLQTVATGMAFGIIVHWAIENTGLPAHAAFYEYAVPIVVCLCLTVLADACYRFWERGRLQNGT